MVDEVVVEYCEIGLCILDVYCVFFVWLCVMSVDVYVLLYVNVCDIGLGIM